MSGTAMVLAGHGSRLDPAVNGLVRDYANRLADLGLFDEVTPAFHHGEPAFATVLDGISADDITVVPLMTSRGYFSEVVLPRDLARNQRYPHVRVRFTEPVGTHPGIISLVARRVRTRLRENDWRPDTTALAVVGHGTERHRGSRGATLRLVGALRKRGLCREVVPAFLDESPHVETILDRVTQSCVVVVPFFISDGPHATNDLPSGLGLTVPDGASPPLTGRVRGRFVTCEAAIGTDHGIIEIVAELAVGTTFQSVNREAGKPVPLVPNPFPTDVLMEQQR